jgi:hypothetical protein
LTAAVSPAVIVPNRAKPATAKTKARAKAVPQPPAPGTWLPKTKAEKALHLSLFPAIPTPQEILQRLSLK